MTKNTMLKYYNSKSVATIYNIGFVYKHEVYTIELNKISPRYLRVEKASRNQGESLRLRLTNKYMEQLIRKGAICIGSEDMLKNEIYNIGEIYEKIQTESYGQKWEKDNIPFWVKGDISTNTDEIQVKFNGASLITTKQITRFKAGLI